MTSATTTAQILQPGQRPGQPATEETIRYLFSTYIGREIGAENLQRMLDGGRTVFEVEAMLRDSREYLLKGPMLHSRFRSHYDTTNLVLAPARLLFCPIAKVANTSVKYWFVKLSDPGGPRPADVHRHIDSGDSGLQARQFSFAALNPVLSGADWARVAILRDPIDRVISAYWDKFVTTRKGPGTLYHTGPIYQQVYDTRDVTPEMVARGATFRQFCHYLARTALGKTDPHWLPQHRYLESYSWDRLFDIDRISEFEDFVRARLAPELRDEPLGMINSAPRAASDTEVEPLADRLPQSLDGMTKPPNAAFLTEDLRRFLEGYYALDFMLVERARRDSAAAAA